MRAELYYLASQEQAVGPLAARLRQHGYAVERQPIALSVGGSDAVHLAERYVKLLQAALPPERGLRVGVVRQDFMSYSFYFRVYSLLRAGESSFQRRLVDFFPALAVGERMVLVPLGLQQLLAVDGEGVPVFAPFGQGGVLEVRFGDGEAVEVALEQVDRTVRADLLREVEAYASYQGNRALDLDQASQDLRIDPGFLQQTLAAGAAERGGYAGLACELSGTELPLGRFSRVSLLVTNASDRELARLTVSIAGPVRVLPSRIEVSLPPRGRQEVAVALMPEEAGDFPLEVSFALPQDRALAGWLPVHHLWLHCE